MTLLKLTLLLLSSLFVFANAQQTQNHFASPFSRNLLPLPNELESKRSSIPEYYQHLLSANIHAFEPRTAAQDTGFTLVDHWAWGPCYAVDVKGNYAYVASGPTMLILDISNPANPHVVTEYKTEPDASGNVNDIKVRDSLLYLLDGFSLQILNITNPIEPKLISIVYSSVTREMALNDSLAFILHVNNGELKILNIKDPFNPFFTKGSGGIGFGETTISEYKNVVYVGTFEDDGLYIFDCTNPDSIKFSAYNVHGWVMQTFVQDTLLFVGVDERPGQELKIYSVADPTQPAFLGKVKISNQDSCMIFGMAAQGTTLHALTYQGGLYTVDVSDPYNPAISDTLLMRSSLRVGGGYSIVATSKFLFSSTVYGMWCASSFPGDRIRSVSHFACGGELFDIAVRDTLAYVTDYNGIAVFDISKPQNIHRLAEVDAPGNTAQIRLYKHYAFVTCAYVGTAIFDISDPAHPQYLSLAEYSLNDGSHPTDILPLNERLYVLDYNAGLLTFDISDLLAPKQISKFPLKGLNFQIAVKDSILYVARRDSGIVLINISVSDNQKYVTTMSKFAEGLGIKDSLLYVKGDGFLSAYKITQPDKPILVLYAHLDGTYYQNPLVFDRNYLYYRYSSKLYAVDISIPAIIDIQPVGDGTYGMDAANSYIFVCDVLKGIRVFKNGHITNVGQNRDNLPTRFSLFQNYPNPFNPATTIRYFLPKRSYIKLVVYSIIGQEISTLVNGIQETGEHEVSFDAPSLASGIYIYMLTADKYFESKKMVVIK